MRRSSLYSSALLLAAAGRAMGNMIPFIDNQCSKPPTSFTMNGSTKSIDTAFPAAIPSVSTPLFYNNPVFGGAASPSNAPGQVVYWQISNLQTECRYVLMQQYSQHSYGAIPGFTAPPGNVIMNAADNGCYFSMIPEATVLSIASCCGLGNCSEVSGGNSALYRREEELDLTSFPDDVAEDKKREEAAQATYEGRDLLDYSDDEIDEMSDEELEEALFARQSSDEWGNCSVTLGTQQPWPEAGQQVLVASQQTCTTSPCDFAVQNSISTATSFSTSTTTTITNTVGGSVAVQGGINFIVEAETTVTATYSWAKAVAKMTGTTITNTTTVAVSNTVGQETGTTAFVSFTPTYLCWLVMVECGDGNPVPFDYCQPQVSSDEKTIEGDYTVVYVG